MLVAPRTLRPFEPPTKAAAVTPRIDELNYLDAYVFLEKVRRTLEVVERQNHELIRDNSRLYLMLGHRTDAIESVLAMTESKVELLHEKFDLLFSVLVSKQALQALEHGDYSVSES